MSDMLDDPAMMTPSHRCPDCRQTITTREKIL